MSNLQKIQEYVLERDGSCRDVSMLTKDKLCTVELLNWFTEKYKDTSSSKIMEDDYHRIKQSEYRHFILTLKEAETLQFWFRNPKETIQELQIFVDAENDNTLSVEISFLPNNISLEQFNVSKLLATISEWRKLCNANDIYLRTENAGWKYGDTSKHSGVIYYEQIGAT